MIIHLFTDGGVDKNGATENTGAYAFAVVHQQGLLHSQAFLEMNTTNNRMEMKAVIAALDYCQQYHPQDTLTLHSDSQYTINGITSWIHGWKKKGWKNGSVLNIDLWKEMDHARLPLDVTFRWIRGHATDASYETEFNCYVDGLCTETINHLVEDLQP